ncbi:MAG: DUF2203 domain-containing protein [Patescibacteria group bacterium]
MGKTFTLEEANRALVFVAPVLKEIQTIWNALMGFQASEDGTAEAVIRSKVDRLKTCNAELAQVGCLMRDPVEGILDFPSFYKNQPVFLCWKLGEEQIEFWHSVSENIQARRPVTEDFLSWNSKVPAQDLNVA